MVDLDRLSDEQLIERARRAPEEEGRMLLDTLYRRAYPKVARWCLRICGGRQEATDVAQEVFLRVHDKLDDFRLDSRFSTWLYVVTRNVAINRGIAANRGRATSLDQDTLHELEDQKPTPEERAETGEIAARLRRAMREDLEPLEAKVLYLHYVNGITLPALTERLGLSNKSGAKAYLVAGKRKLERKFGRWLAVQSMTGDGR